MEDDNIYIKEAIGLFHCSNQRSIYYLVLESFYLEGMDKVKEMQAAYQKEDYQLCRILVHGVKSIAGSIGAILLSKEAEGLELAFIEGRIDEVKEEWVVFIELYQNTLNQSKKMRNEK